MSSFSTKRVTTKEQIRDWLLLGVQSKATHMIVACDTFSYEDFPIYVQAGEDVRERAKIYNDSSKMLSLMEVYALHLDMEEQLAEHRAMHLDSPPGPNSVYERLLEEDVIG